jgi:signal transduction histidine kinase
MRIVACIFIAVMFSANIAKAQSDMTERLLRIEREIAVGNMSDSITFLKYDTLVFFYAQRDIEKFRLFYPKAIAFALEKKNKMWEATYLRKKAANLFFLGETDSLLIFLDRAIKLIEGKGNWVEESSNYELRGYYYKGRSEHEKAIDQFQKSLEIIVNEKNKKIAAKQDISQSISFEANLYNHFATLYYQLRNLEKSAEYLLRAVNLFEEHRSETHLRHESLAVRNLAQVYMEMGHGEKALPMLLRSYEIAKSVEDFYTMVYCLQSLSNYYRTVQKDFNLSLNYAKEGLKIAEQTQQPILINQADDAMFEICYAMKDYKTALYHAERMLGRTQEDDLESLRNIYSGLIRIHASMGNTEKMEDFLTKFKELTEKISDKNLHASLQEMNVKYNTAQKDLDLERQQAETNRQKTQKTIFIVSSLFLVLLGVLLAYNVMLRNRRNRDLTKTNATKDKFFSIISHDLKNPATAQRDALQLFTENVRKWDVDKLHSYSERLLKSADSHANLIFTLLDWAQMQAGRMPYTPASFDLANALQSDIGIIKNMAENKEVALNVQMPQQTFVTGDCDMLVTVIRNLLANAVKFTAKGGTVTLEASPIPLPSASPSGFKGGEFTISVSDTGTGMTPEQVQILFKLDKQQSRKGTVGEQGTGLGLIVCQEMLEKHGSVLKVESEVGKGSRFWFELK